MRFLMTWLLIVSVNIGLQAQTTFTLEEAIDYALKNSRQAKMTDLEVAQADAEIAEVKSRGLPQVNAGVDYNYYFYTPVNPVEDFITPAIYGVLQQEFPGEVTEPTGDPQIFQFSFFPKNNLTARIDGSMLLFDGSYLTGLKAARLFKDLRMKRKSIVEEEIRSQVTKAYMNILITKENLNTLADNIENINSSLREAAAFYENGFMEQLDVDRINLSMESVKTEEERLKNYLEITHELLKFQMNYPLQEELTISENLEDLIAVMQTEVDENYAKVNYNDKAQYSEIKLGLEMNKLNIERLEKGFLPSLSARAGISESLQRNKLFDSSEAGWLPTVYAGLALNVPITDGKLKKSSIQKAELELEKNNLLKSEFERGVDLQVKTAYNNFKSSKKTLDNRKRSLEIVESIYQKTQIKFKEGVGSSLEVTQAEMQLFDAQAKYINALYDLLNSKTDLDIALGKL